MDILKVQDLKKTYGGKGASTVALKGVSFNVEEGEFVGIMGASGSGKTTLLSCIATIDRPTSGSIVIDGGEVTALRPKQLTAFRREKLGFIFQDCNLLDTLTAFENIALALSIRGDHAGNVERKVKETAVLLGIEGCLQKFPYQLSGGQQQRVAAARAIVTNPALILADEPTGALDSKSAGMLLECMEELNEQQGATILMVTHDAFTASWCHRILFLRDGEVYGTLRREGRSRRAFFKDVMAVVAELGGGNSDVL
ncbi:MAG: ABC transporter ATP-binding protein [Oscillospiraceae bacterium]|nr:ABC transporter ATP-binding protein [Oscillospiraceae bacterium]